MNTNFTVIGGNLRIIKLAKMLAEDGNQVYTYGVEKAEELKENENIKKLKRNFNVIELQENKLLRSSIIRNLVQNKEYDKAKEYTKREIIDYIKENNLYILDKKDN